MKTAIYLRVSTREQSEEGFSIRAQKQRLEAYVESQDWSIYDYYIDEGKSAKDTNRTQLKRMMDDVENIDVILVYKLDRLTRSVLDLYNLLDYFDKYDTKFKSATEIYDTTTATGRLFLTLVAALAQWERENLSERVSMGMQRMVEEGKWHGGILPFGYKVVNGEIAIDEIEAPTVEVIFDIYATGKGGKQICHHLNEHINQYPTRKAKYWDVSHIHRILSNPAYVGNFRYKDQLIKDFGPRIISDNLFERVSTIKRSRTDKHPREIRSDYLFTGLIRCARCNNKMHGKKKESRGNTYMMYSCAGRTSGICDMPYLNEVHIESELLKSLESSLDYHTGRLDMIETKDTLKEVERLNKQISTIKDRKKKWQFAFVNEAITLEDLQERNAEDEKEKIELEKKRSELSNENVYNVEDVLSITKNWYKLKKEERKILVHSMLTEIKVNCENGRMGRGKKRVVWVDDFIWSE